MSKFWSKLKFKPKTFLTKQKMFRLIIQINIVTSGWLSLLRIQIRLNRFWLSRYIRSYVFFFVKQAIARIMTNLPWATFLLTGRRLGGRDFNRFTEILPKLQLPRGGSRPAVCVLQAVCDRVKFSREKPNVFFGNVSPPLVFAYSASVHCGPEYEKNKNIETNKFAHSNRVVPVRHDTSPSDVSRESTCCGSMADKSENRLSHIGSSHVVWYSDNGNRTESAGVAGTRSGVGRNKKKKKIYVGRLE